MVKLLIRNSKDGKIKLEQTYKLNHIEKGILPVWAVFSARSLASAGTKEISKEITKVAKSKTKALEIMVLILKLSV